MFSFSLTITSFLNGNPFWGIGALEYTFEISKEEEDYILSDMGDNGKRNYINTIKEQGLGDDYMLYAMAITKESVRLFRQLLLSLQGK